MLTVGKIPDFGVVVLALGSFVSVRGRGLVLVLGTGLTVLACLLYNAATLECSVYLLEAWSRFAWNMVVEMVVRVLELGE